MKKKGFLLYLLLWLSHSSKSCPIYKSMLSYGLVDIKTVDKSIQVNLKYATTDNFIKKNVYGCLKTCFLQKETATMLAKANQYLHKTFPSLNILVYDATRPLHIQKKLWDSLKEYPPEKRSIFVANPSLGSIHNYGCAVDVTLVDRKGIALDMGTKYDYFGELAYPSKEETCLKKGLLTKKQVENRRLLRKVMQQAGFFAIDYEWWHFNAMSRNKAKKTYKIIP